ncbi:MAG: glycosyltransferase family 4 protein [Elusimicrobia bacterium]|nr:glycosyltransferase family 4 protein [Elusimicrobiota bacterium]
MRILHAYWGTPSAVSMNGVGQAVFALTREQSRLGHSVGVAAPKQPQAGFPVIGHTLPRSLAALALGGADALLARARPDFLHLHSIFIPQWAILARRARARGIAYCVSPHGGLSSEAAAGWNPAKRAYRSLVEQPLLRGASFIHVTGPADEPRAIGVDARAVFAPNGVDVPPKGPARGNGGLRTALGLPRDALLFGTLGRIAVEQKGLDRSVKALAASGLCHAHLVLIGKDYRGGADRLRCLARALGVAERLHLPGPSLGPARWAQLCDLDFYVQLSRWEGMSVSVLEAAGLGLPCLLSREADPAGLLGAEAAAFLAPDPDDAGPLFVRAAADGTEARAALGERARSAVLREYRWEKSAAALLEAYRAARDTV